MPPRVDHGDSRTTRLWWRNRTCFVCAGSGPPPWRFPEVGRMASSHPSLTVGPTDGPEALFLTDLPVGKTLTVFSATRLLPHNLRKGRSPGPGRPGRRVEEGERPGHGSKLWEVNAWSKRTVG